MGVPGVTDRAERQVANSLNLIRLIPAEGFEMDHLQAAADLFKIRSNARPGAIVAAGVRCHD